LFKPWDNFTFYHEACLVSYSNQVLFSSTEPKEIAANISSSGISARIINEECNFGGRSKRASSCHAALMFYMK
jgi:hypothetical protein